MKEIKLYVGLNDSETLKQEHDTADYVSVLKTVCFNYHVPFSIRLEQGGYMDEQGRYTQELTLVISFIDVPQDTIREIAGDLCAFFNQESVLVTEDNVEAYFVKKKLEGK